MKNPKKIIAVCIATFKRPGLLENCLVSISELETPADYIPLVIVVDNDRETSAEIIFHKKKDIIKFDSYYYVEPDRGLSSARNRLLEKALEHHADYIAFIDDDELAHKKWLINLVQGLEKYNTDIVAGPVVPIYETKVPDSFHVANKHPSGSSPRHIPAGNVLFKKTLINESGLRFDHYFNFIGGEDFDFFERAKKNNMTVVWVDDAVVFETITPDRKTLKYIMYRHLTGGINVVLRYKRHHHPILAWSRYLPKAIGKFFGATVALIMAVFISRKQNLENFIVKLSNGAGYLCGLTNFIFERYRYDE